MLVLLALAAEDGFLPEVEVGGWTSRKRGLVMGTIQRSRLRSRDVGKISILQKVVRITRRETAVSKDSLHQDDWWRRMICSTMRAHQVKEREGTWHRSRSRAAYAKRRTWLLNAKNPSATIR